MGEEYTRFEQGLQCTLNTLLPHQTTGIACFETAGVQ